MYTTDTTNIPAQQINRMQKKNSELTCEVGFRNNNTYRGNK